ncbi:MAG: hypothetical protein IJ246_10135 [Clostridia bacterium]|nr:hypothetical protein [Clostridia bacterium]
MKETALPFIDNTADGGFASRWLFDVRPVRSGIGKGSNAAVDILSGVLAVLFFKLL